MQDVPYAKLRELLLKDGQVLEYAGAAPAGGKASKGAKGFVDPKKLGGVVVDDDDAKLTGNWQSSSAAPNFIGNGYRHDGNTKDGKATARFDIRVPKSGHYDVRIAYPPNANRSSKVAVEITHAGGKETVFVDQRKTPAIDERFHLLGRFDFTEGSRRWWWSRARGRMGSW